MSEIDEARELGFWERALDRRTMLLGSAGAIVGGTVLGRASASFGAVSRGSASGTLRFASGTATPNDKIDPIRQLSNFEIIAVGTVFDALVRVDTRFLAHPSIVESWDASNGGKRWMLKIRHGVHFHDGSPVTSKDVVYSIQRNLDPKGTSPVVGLLGPYLKPQNVRAVGSDAVQLDLEAPYSFIPVALGNRYMRLIKAGATDFSHPIGTGPFVFGSHTPGQSFAATANPNYWGGKPPISAISSTNVSDSSARLQALLSGNVDVLEFIDYSQVPQVKNAGKNDLVLLKDAYIPTIDLDLRKPPFNDPRVVQAIKLAIDRPQIISTVFQGLGSIGYDEPIPKSDGFFGGLPTPQHDVAKAKALLRAAGHRKGVQSDFYVSEVGSSMVDFGVAVAAQLKDAGINFKVHQWPAATYWDDVWLKKSASTPIYIRRHPNEILTYLATTKGVWNGTHWSDKRFDRDVAQARRTLAYGRQKQLYGDAERLMSRNDGHIMPALTHLVSAKQHNVQNVGTNFISLLDFSRTSIS